VTFALVRVELALRFGHEPVLQDVWAEYTRRHPDTICGLRAIVARGLVACPDTEKPTAETHPVTLADGSEFVPRWWQRLESIRLSVID
jgi:hypothetical protein